MPAAPLTDLCGPFHSTLGLGEGGTLCWLKGTMHGDRLEHQLKSVPGPYLATTLAGAGRIIAIARQAIVYLRVSEGAIKEKCRQAWSAYGTVACFVSHLTQELILVGGNASLSRVQLLR